MKEIVPTQLSDAFQYVTWLVNLGHYSHLPVCATSSIPSFTGVHQRQVYIDESGFNIFTWRSKGRAPLGQRVRRVVAPRGRNINITLAISPDMGLVHHVKARLYSSRFLKSTSTSCSRCENARLRVSRSGASLSREEFYGD